MKKNILLSLILCTGALSACSSFSNASDDVPLVDDDIEVIDATVDANERCGVDGISCNDTALINYTKTEADYRAYGERTKRDHLYTQSGTGDNIAATIPPSIEEDIVTEYRPTSEFEPSPEFEPQYDEFAQTNPQNLTQQYPLNNYSGVITHPGYQVVCQQNCDQFSSMFGNIEDNNVSSEFTEESFNIADYIKNNGLNGEDIEFIEIGEQSEVVEVGEKEQSVGDAKDIMVWDAKEGDTLRELLTRWSALAGWKLLWNTNRNYTLSAGVMFKGKFTDVSSALVRAFARARPAPIATFYKGNRVIVVETMENENAY